jgi:lipid A 3-O-deacylase
MQRTLCAVLCAGLLAVATRAPAAGQAIVSEVQIGVLAHDVPILGEQHEHGADIDGELRFLSPVPDAWVAGVAPGWRWLLTPRPNVGFDANTSGYTSQLYFGLTWTAELFRGVLSPQDAVFVDLGFGPAFNNGHTMTASSRRSALGSNVLFHPSVDIGYRFNARYSASLYFEHSSNAGLSARNQGLDNLGVRLGLRF